MSNVFEIRNLDLFYDEFQALKNINLDIEENRVTAFIGPSGCGKSTFLRCLNRMNDLIDICKITGEIRFKEQDVYEEGYDVINLRTNVGMVFQKPNPFPMSIYDNVAFGPRCQGIKDKSILDEIVKDALVKAALWDDVSERLEKSAMGLSGGQQQRLCIARAIAMEPSVILMDEPTSALDPIATQKIENLIEELKKDYTIIIVTHSMQQAARISDKTVFFLLGEIIEEGTTKMMFSNPTKRETEDYITGKFG